MLSAEISEVSTGQEARSEEQSKRSVESQASSAKQFATGASTKCRVRRYLDKARGAKCGARRYPCEAPGDRCKPRSHPCIAQGAKCRAWRDPEAVRSAKYWSRQLGTFCLWQSRAHYLSGLISSRVSGFPRFPPVTTPQIISPLGDFPCVVSYALAECFLIRETL